MLQCVENSILNGSKEVALAAINCLQTTVNSHSSKVGIMIWIRADLLFVGEEYLAEFIVNHL